ncbi:MAG: transcriptional regulator, partial [Gammaproteobacteria bacterium]|nr:transcriptional regulator [Gammaproteobacteria bacterium]
VMQALMKRGLIRREEEKRVGITPAGRRWFDALGIDVAQLRPTRHGIARACLDWTQRQHHLAGPLGAGLFERMIELKWLRRERRSRIVHVTPAGQRQLASLLGVTSSA